MVTFNRCGHEYIARCPNVALSGEEGATCSEHALPGELDQFRDRHARVSKREAELHYAVRKDANILDHKLTEDEAHAMALAKVAKMHLVWEAAHEVNKELKATNGKVSFGAWAKLADALDVRLTG